MRAIIVGQTFAESRTVQRVAALRSLGISVICVPTVPEGKNYESSPNIYERIRYRLRVPNDPANANERTLKEVENGADILWLDAADMIDSSTLRQAKQINKNLKIIWYSEDDMMNPRLRTRQIDGSLNIFDLWVTTKSFNAQSEELPALGVKNVLFVNNSCDPFLHRFVSISEEDKIRFGSPISFIGSFENPRAESLLYLASMGQNVRVWGNGWGNLVNRHPNLKIENRPAYNEDFTKVISASSINLCFLRKANRDLQTCRSIEIPSCSGFMVHERNREITSIFRDGKEAIYFSSDKELFKTCSFWIGRKKHRIRIGKAALKRTIELEMTHKANVERILNAAFCRKKSMSL
jgi:spore maturation protein CgeB